MIRTVEGGERGSLLEETLRSGIAASGVLVM